jgi:translation elongation factor EF-4
MTFLLNQRPVDALAMVVHKFAHETVGRVWAKRLSKFFCMENEPFISLSPEEVIPRQLFEVPIQAVVNNKVVARETISAARKDVTAPLYGGDFTRKKKLLEQQKRGKKNLKRVGKVDLPQEAFFSLLRK